MRRWIIVILALQFFCSVSTFAYGQSRIDLSSADLNSFTISAIGEDSEALLGDHPSVLDAQHDLLDEKPDLPEWISLIWPSLCQTDPWDVPRAFVSRDRVPLALAGPQRPPQA